MKKHHARRLLSFLASAHGFKPPFDVLLDSTAIQASLIHGVTLEEAKKLLGEKVRCWFRAWSSPSCTRSAANLPRLRRLHAAWISWTIRRVARRVRLRR